MARLSQESTILRKDRKMKKLVIEVDDLVEGVLSAPMAREEASRMVSCNHQQGVIASMEIENEDCHDVRLEPDSNLPDETLLT